MRETYNDRSPPRSFGCVSCACAPMPMLAIEVRRRDVKSFMLAGYWFNLVCMRYVWCVSVSFQSMILSMCAGAGVWVRRRACSFWIFLFIGFLLFIYEHCGYLQDLVLHVGTRVGILLDLGVGYIRTLLTTLVPSTFVVTFDSVPSSTVCQVSQYHRKISIKEERTGLSLSRAQQVAYH